MDALTAALQYEKLGFSVIPLKTGEKVPMIDWKEFQTRRATDAEIAAWWVKWPKSNIGIVTGTISGICVVDLDRYKENLSTFLTVSKLLPRQLQERELIFG
jgi:hypothetical protein